MLKLTVFVILSFINVDFSLQIFSLSSGFGLLFLVVYMSCRVVSCRPYCQRWMCFVCWTCFICCLRESGLDL